MNADYEFVTRFPVIRTPGESAQQPIIQFKDLEVDRVRHGIWKAGLVKHQKRKARKQALKRATGDHAPDCA